MKQFGRVLIYCVFNALLVTGSREEVYLLTDDYEIHRYNTKTKKTKEIAKNVEYMACDYTRKFIYYLPRHKRNQDFTKIFRMNRDGGDVQIIVDKASSMTSMSIDQETGNLYYDSLKGLGFYSYKQNYRNTILLSSTVDLFLYNIRVYGKGDNKRVYWSTVTHLYSLQTRTSKRKRLGVDCLTFNILDDGMLCNSNHKKLYLANLDGVKTESLPNTTITSTVLEDIYCSGSVQDIITVNGNIYILCHFPNQVLKVGSKNSIVKNLIPTKLKALRSKWWHSMCAFPFQAAVLPAPSALLPDFSIWMVVGATVIAVVLIVILAVVIRKYKKEKGSRQSNNHQSGEPEMAQYSSAHDNRVREDHVYTTFHSNGYIDLTAEEPPIYAVIS